mgnify:CR=1 FL=1
MSKTFVRSNNVLSKESISKSVMSCSNRLEITESPP